MQEKFSTSPENKKKPWEISKNTRKLIQAFSLSAWIVLAANSSANEINTYDTEKSTQKIQKNLENKENKIYNELKYLFVEKQDGFMQSIIQKSKDEWIYYDELQGDLQYFENILVLTFKEAIKKNGLELEYSLEPKLVELMNSMKSTFTILLNLRYWDWVYDIFDWKDYSNYKLRITFKKSDNSYKLESLYIVSPNQELNEKWVKSKGSFYQDLV